MFSKDLNPCLTPCIVKSKSDVSAQSQSSSHFTKVNFFYHFFCWPQAKAKRSRITFFCHVYHVLTRSARNPMVLIAAAARQEQTALTILLASQCRRALIITSLPQAPAANDEYTNLTKTRSIRTCFKFVIIKNVPLQAAYGLWPSAMWIIYKHVDYTCAITVPII